MSYKELTKKLSFQASAKFSYEDLRAKILTRADLKADMEGVNSSLELIRKTRGGSWPSEIPESSTIVLIATPYTRHPKQIQMYVGLSEL